MVIYRELHISDDELLAFSRLSATWSCSRANTSFPRYKPSQWIPRRPTRCSRPTVRGHFHWHFDGATDVLPQKATLLSAREVDPAGGDTEFASTYAAFDAIGNDERQELEGLRVVHTFAHAQSLANPAATESERKSWERVPARIHPLIGQGERPQVNAAGSNRAGDRRLVGLRKSRAARQTSWTGRPNLASRLRQKWHKGDLVIWDDAGMLHRATHFEPTSVRLLHRTTLAGEEPTGA